MAVAGDGDQLAHATPALCGRARNTERSRWPLPVSRPNECVVQIGSCTQGQIGQPIERIPGGLRVDGGERSAVAGVHGLQQVIAAFVA